MLKVTLNLDVAEGGIEKVASQVVSRGALDDTRPVSDAKRTTRDIIADLKSCRAF
jgi:hypothetical protein